MRNEREQYMSEPTDEERQARRAAGMCEQCGKEQTYYKGGTECVTCLDRYEEEWLREQRRKNGPEREP